MENLTPFAQVPPTPEPVIAQVLRQLTEDARRIDKFPITTLERVADHAVRDLWGGRIKTFVPLLALRQARETLRLHEIVTTAASANTSDSGDTATLGQRQDDRLSPDVLRLDYRRVAPR